METAKMMRAPKSLDYWRDVAHHPLGEVIPGLVAITASQWKFWEKRPLIIQADLAMGNDAIAVAKDETKEKKLELEKLYRGDTTPLMVAMEAADEIVFLDIFVGMHAGDMGIWDQVKKEALALAYGARDTIAEMQKLAHKRREFGVAEMLNDLPKFVANVVIGDKNESNYHPAYFVPAPHKYGDRGQSKPVSKDLLVSVYDRARAEARRGRTAIKNQGLYTATGMPNHLAMFARMNGNTPPKYQEDHAVLTIQDSLRAHYQFYAETFGQVGVDFLINYFRLNDPQMMEVVTTSIAQTDLV